MNIEVVNGDTARSKDSVLNREVPTVQNSKDVFQGIDLPDAIQVEQENNIGKFNENEIARLVECGLGEIKYLNSSEIKKMRQEIWETKPEDTEYSAIKFMEKVKKSHDLLSIAKEINAKAFHILYKGKTLCGKEGDEFIERFCSTIDKILPEEDYKAFIDKIEKYLPYRDEETDRYLERVLYDLERSSSFPSLDKVEEANYLRAEFYSALACKNGDNFGEALRYKHLCPNVYSDVDELPHRLDSMIYRSSDKILSKRHLFGLIDFGSDPCLVQLLSATRNYHSGDYEKALRQFEKLSELAEMKKDDGILMHAYYMTYKCLENFRILQRLPKSWSSKNLAQVRREVLEKAATLGSKLAQDELESFF